MTTINKTSTRVPLSPVHRNPMSPLHRSPSPLKRFTSGAGYATLEAQKFSEPAKPEPVSLPHASHCATQIAAAAAASPHAFQGSPVKLPSKAPPPGAPASKSALPTRQRSVDLESSLWLGPRSEQVTRWLVLLAVGLNVLIFPVLLAFDGPVGSDSPWFGLTMIADVVLWLDVLCRFVTPVAMADEGGDGDEEVREISHGYVARAYLRSGDLLVDVLCRFPWDAVSSGARAAPFAFSTAHLPRLLTLRRALAIWHSRVGSAPKYVGSGQRLAALCSVSLVVLHWYACAQWLLGVHLEREGRPSWVHDAAEAASAQGVEWPWPLWARYMRSFDRGLLTVLGEGLRGEAHEEVALALTGLMGGTVWLAYFTSTLVQLVTTINHQEELARAKIGRVAMFCRHAKIPPPLQARVRNHLEHVLLAKKLSFDTDELLAELSAPLRGEVALHRCSSFMLNPKFVGILGGGADGGVQQGKFIKALVRKLSLVVFSPGDFAMEEGEVGEEVYFLSRGRVAVIAGERQVATLSSGACFGEIALLVPGALRTASIVAVTFCEAHALSRADFEQCLGGFPEMHARIKMIAERRVAELKEMATRKKRPRPPAANGGGSKRDADADADAADDADDDGDDGDDAPPLSLSRPQIAAVAALGAPDAPPAAAPEPTGRLRRGLATFSSGLGALRLRSSATLRNGGGNGALAGAGDRRNSDPGVSAFTAVARAAAANAANAASAASAANATATDLDVDARRSSFGRRRRFSSPAVLPAGASAPQPAAPGAASAAAQHAEVAAQPPPAQPSKNKVAPAPSTPGAALAAPTCAPAKLPPLLGAPAGRAPAPLPFAPPPMPVKRSDGGRVSFY